MKINFRTTEGHIKDVQIRQKEDGTQYAVLRISAKDDFDGFRLRKSQKTPATKDITLLCFIPAMFESFQVVTRAIFKGFVSFGYGNTFLVLEDYIDARTGESFLDASIPY
jgi:hypothetical protein